MASIPKSVLITGCSAGGIGAGLAEVFHEKDIMSSQQHEPPSKIPGFLAEAPNVTVLTLDVSSSESIAAAFMKVNEETDDKLDVLVNDSGKPYIMPDLDASIEEGKKVFDLNYWAVLSMIQTFAPLLIKAKGCIANNTSFNGAVPVAFFSMYMTSSLNVSTPDPRQPVRREMEDKPLTDLS